MQAPAAIAARITAGLRVSTEIGTPLSPQNLKERDRPGGGGVEGIDFSGHRQGGDEVAMLPHQSAHARALAADNEHRGQRQTRRKEIDRIVSAIQPDRPTTGRLGGVERAGQIRDAGNK